MRADLLDAHDRHWKDAETLFSRQRYANADHLYGLAAECALKCLMQKFGMPVDSGYAPQKPKDRVHINEVWGRYEAYRSGKPQGAAYALPSKNPFQCWRIADRYAHQSRFDLSRVNRHRGGAEMACNLIRNAQKAGLL